MSLRDMNELDEEPLLKYSKLTLGLDDLSDGISCVSVTDRFIALGTHGGKVHLLDLIGTLVKTWTPHSAAVSQTCIDSAAEHVASASRDGRCCIHNLFSFP